MACSLLPLSYCPWVNPSPRLSDWARGTKARLRYLCVTDGHVRQGRRCGARFPVCMAAPAVFQNLEADDFRHPLDKQNTLLLSMVPGLNELGKALLGPVGVGGGVHCSQHCRSRRSQSSECYTSPVAQFCVCTGVASGRSVVTPGQFHDRGPIAEQFMILENIGTSVLVSENQLSNVHQLLLEAAKVLSIEPPDLYLRQNPVPNAYTLAISGKKPFIVVHTSLVELLSKKELQAVLAHELGHLKCDHGVWLSFANILTLGAYNVPGFGGFIAQWLEEQLLRWLRAAELTCDRAALLVAQDPKVVISVLMKLAGGSPSLSNQLNVDAFLEQAQSYDKASSSPFGWYIRNAQTRQLSHPLPIFRAREIDEWSRSSEYQSLLKRAVRHKTSRSL